MESEVRIKMEGGKRVDVDNKGKRTWEVEKVMVLEMRKRMKWERKLD